MFPSSLIYESRRGTRFSMWAAVQFTQPCLENSPPLNVVDRLCFIPKPMRENISYLTV